MAERKQCEFQLIRYVPDPVKNEFVNIGVLLRASTGEQTVLRFTRDWARVLCLDPDADTQMFEALEIEIGQRLRSQPADHPKPILGSARRVAFQWGADHRNQGVSGGELCFRDGGSDAPLC